MICYKDMTFCSRDCANKNCKRNKKNIDKPPHLKWMPVAYSEFENCEKFKESKVKARQRNDKRKSIRGMEEDAKRDR